MTPVHSGFRRPTGRPLEVAGVFALSIAALYFGRGIFVPLVLAVLFAFALNPLVDRVRRLHTGHLAAVIVTVTLVTAIALGVAYLTASQLTKLAADLPQYQQTVATKLRALMGGGEHSPFGRLADTIDNLSAQLSSADATAAADKPVAVTISDAQTSPLEGLIGMIESILEPLATAALVVIFSIFLLLDRVDLRDRFLKLVSRGDLRTSTKVMNESAGRVSKYLLVQFAVNAGFGIAFGAGMFALGVPNAILWGLLSIVFRYVPFIGTLVAVLLPGALAFAVDPGWGMLIGVVALYLFLELVTTNAIEPRLYGSSTGISGLAVLVAAVFWATLWGPIGLVLATPITVCLFVLGRYVPQMAFLDTLLGSEPALAPDERLYQRLLAANVAEALELSEAELEDRDLTEVFDRVFIPALRLAETDLQLDASDLARRKNVVETVTGVIEELDSGEVAETPTADASVLVIGGRTELDGAAAAMLGRSLSAVGIGVRQLPPMALNKDGISQLDAAAIQIVCVCYLGSNPQPFLRYVAGRLHRKNRDIKVVACLFGTDQIDGDTDLSNLRSDAVAHTIAEAIEETVELVQAHDASRLPEPVEPGRSHLELMQKTMRSEEWMAKASKAIAKTFEVPHVSIQPDRGDDDNSHARLHQYVVETGEPLLIGDTALASEDVDHTELVENGFKSYLGVPAKTEAGDILGTVGIYDNVPRDFSTSADRLTKMVGELVAELEGRSAATANSPFDNNLVQIAVAS